MSRSNISEQLFNFFFLFRNVMKKHLFYMYPVEGITKVP